MVPILSLCLVMIQLVAASEPQCSPFHYQEQMIEKIVKLEILVQKMKNDMDATKQRVSEEIESLNAEKKHLVSEWETEKTAMETQLQQLMKRNNDEMKTISSEYQEMVKASRAETDAIRDSAVTPTVAFVSKDLTNNAASSGDILIYKTSMLNEGQGYNNSTGRFTAPVGGSYLFTAQFCMYGGDSKYIYYAFVTDGMFIKRGYFRSQTSFTCHSSDAVTVLKAGAQVWVTCPSITSSFHQHDDYWNSFSGILLYK